MFFLALLILGSFVIAFGSFLNAFLFSIAWISALVVIGRYLGKHYGSAIDGTMQSIMTYGTIGGIILGIALVVVGFFKDAGQETVSYENWHGDTITYIADRVSNMLYFGFVVFALAFTIMFLYFGYFSSKDDYVPKAQRKAERKKLTPEQRKLAKSKKFAIETYTNQYNSGLITKEQYDRILKDIDEQFYELKE